MIDKEGDWLFDDPQWTLWMQQPELRNQLPLLYRLFAEYCVWQKRVLGGRRVRKGPEIFAIIRSLSRRFPVPTSTQISNGEYTVSVDLLDPRFLRVVAELFEKNDEIDILKLFLKPGDTFVDVGANHGSFSIVAAHEIGPQGFIFAIEPQVRLANLVKQSLVGNAQCSFQVEAIACGDRDSEVEFYVPHGTSGSAGVFASFSAAAPHQTFKIPLRRFDDYVEWEQFPGQICLKLDVEGSEYAFFQGARKFLMVKRPNILMEVNPDSLAGANIAWAEIATLLAEVGYHSYVELTAPRTPLPLAELSPQPYRNIWILSHQPPALPED